MLGQAHVATQQRVLPGVPGERVLTSRAGSGREVFGGSGVTQPTKLRKHANNESFSKNRCTIRTCCYYWS